MPPLGTKLWKVPFHNFVIFLISFPVHVVVLLRFTSLLLLLTSSLLSSFFIFFSHSIHIPCTCTLHIHFEQYFVLHSLIYFLLFSVAHPPIFPLPLDFVYFAFCTCIFVSHFLPGLLTFSLLFYFFLSIYFSLFFSLSHCFSYCFIFQQHDGKTYSGTQLPFYVTLH